MIITLIGYMGSGKSSIGRRLADALEWPLLDLDDYIEHQECQTITHIFAHKGEQHFRDLEKKYLTRIIGTNDNIVLALGGGTPCYDHNWPTISQTTSIYLSKSTDALYQNLKDKKGKRPLIKDMDNEQLKDFIKEKLKIRHPFYSRAMHAINADTTKKEVVRKILDVLNLALAASEDKPKVRRRFCLSHDLKHEAFALWNAVYPVQVAHNTVLSLEDYLHKNAVSMHYLIYKKSIGLMAWAFVMDRDDEPWIGLMVRRQFQQMGLGQKLLEQLKRDHDSLAGWVIDHDDYACADGSVYFSPIRFYEKQGFQMVESERIETDKLTAVKVLWSKLPQ